MSQKEDDEGDGAGAKPNLDGVNPALGKSVPQSLPDGHTDVHGPLHYNHISQRNWEQEDQCKGRQPQPIGKVATENPAVEPGNDPKIKRGVRLISAPVKRSRKRRRASGEMAMS